jgi:hypothetical protein
MCIDEAAGRIYLYGGWDGERSLDDFWAYSIAEGQWHVVLPPHEVDDAAAAAPPVFCWPGRRSCHKMAFDAGTGRIFLLGCLGVSDDDLRETEPPRGARSSGAGAGAADAGDPRAPARRADFYAYHTRGDDAGTWELLSANTEVMRLRPFLDAYGV